MLDPQSSDLTTAGGAADTAFFREHPDRAYGLRPVSCVEAMALLRCRMPPGAKPARLLCVMATWWCDREVIERRLVEVSKREWAYATYLATKNALEYEYTIERLFNAGRTLYRDELVGSVLEGVS